jgi:hypothetical protein
VWLSEAAAAGTTRIRVKMATAVELAALHGATLVDRALGQAAADGRFAEDDLPAILTHQATTTGGGINRAGQEHTLAQGTTAWAGFGTTTPSVEVEGNQAEGNQAEGNQAEGSQAGQVTR